MNLSKEVCITVIGIDPGTGRCGYSVITFTNHQPNVVTYGCFEYPSIMPLHERLVNLEQEMANLLDTYSAELMAVETLLFNKNITTAMQVAEARGVIVLSAAKRSVPIQHCSPLQVKMALTGYGRADKTQVKQMVKLQCRMQEVHKLDDAVDALAIGITGYHLQLGQRVK